MPPTRKSQFRVYLHAEQDSVVYPMPFLTRDSRVKDLFKAAELATGLSMEWQNIYYIDQCDLNPDHQLRDFHVVHRSHFTTHIPDELAKLLMDVRDGDWRKIVNHGISPYLPTGNGWIVEPVNWQRTRSRLNFAWMSAARFGLHQIGAALLSLGANLNVTTHYGRTALHMAAAHGHIGVLQLLAQKGANLRVTDCDGVTPLAIARKHGHMAFARSLNRLDWLVRVRGVQPRFLNLPLKAFQLCDSKYPKWRQDPDGKLYLEKTTKLHRFAGNGLDAPQWKWPDLEAISSRKRGTCSKLFGENSPQLCAYAAHCTRLNKQHEASLCPQIPL